LHQHEQSTHTFHPFPLHPADTAIV
jgi:hypothetical protein